VSCYVVNVGIYNGSKGALAAASETWRHELQPLGVRVITLITTGVRTQFFSAPMVTPLPETSPYHPVREFVASMADGRLQKNAISAEEYAVSVVKAVESGRTGILWAGSDSYMGLFMGLLPQFVVVSAILSDCW
jgi:1-acylglycerone phosphate reductase